MRDFIGQLFDRQAKPKMFKVRTGFDPQLWVECRVSAQSVGKYYPGGQVVFEL